MITTITLNPSVDIRFTVTNFYAGGIFRAQDSQQTAGGKGLNVTRVLHQLGTPVLALGFIGGSNGEFIKAQLDRAGIASNFVTIRENTRVCIAVLAGQSQTEVLGRGPRITAGELTRFMESYEQALDRSRLVCISGSIPQGVPAEIYREMILYARNRKARVFLDTSGEPLRIALTARPYLVKPNQEELELLLGRELKSEKDIIQGMYELSNQGIELVVVSLGSQGALALNGSKLYKIGIPQVRAVNPVGSGDAMIAGLAHAFYNNLPFPEMLALGTACGISNAMQEQTGCIDPCRISDLAGKVKIEEISCP